MPVMTCFAAFNIQDLVQYVINTDASGKVAIVGIDNGLVYKSYTGTYIVKTEEQAKLSKNFCKKISCPEQKVPGEMLGRLPPLSVRPSSVSTLKRLLQNCWADLNKIM